MKTLFPMTLPSKMQVIEIINAGEASSLALASRAVPVPKPDEILIKVAYAGINRADLFQRAGSYAPPEGASDVMGLEVSGHIVAMGKNVEEWQINDAVCALLSGGGYAEYAVAHAGHCLKLPAPFGLKESAALPEALATIEMSLLDEAGMIAGERLLVHGGASGIGTMAIQVAKLMRCEVFVTVGSPEKAALCESLGATPILYKEQDFLEVIKHAGGVDIVLDMVGGSYMQKNLSALRSGGRIVNIAFLQGAKAELNMAGLMMKQARWSGVTLRARSNEQKAMYMQQIEQNIWPEIAKGRLKPVIDSVWPLAQADEAHKKMQKSLHSGKILLQIAP